MDAEIISVLSLYVVYIRRRDMAATRELKWMALHALLERHGDRRVVDVIGQPFRLLFVGNQSAAIRRAQLATADLQHRHVYAHAIRKMSFDAPLCEIAPLREMGRHRFRLTFGYSDTPDPLLGDVRTVLVDYHFTIADGSGGAVFDAIDDLQHRRSEWTEEPPGFLERSFFVALCVVACVNPNDDPLLPTTPPVELDELVAALREIVPPPLVSVKPAKT